MFTYQKKKIIINTTPTFEYLIAALNKQNSFRGVTSAK